MINTKDTKSLLDKIQSKLIELSDMDSKLLKDIEKDYIKLHTAVRRVKTDLMMAKEVFDQQVDIAYSEAVKGYMLGDLELTLSEAKVFAKSDEEYKKVLTKKTQCDRLIIMCDEIIESLKAIGWALKRRSDAAIHSLDDLIM